MIDNIFSVLVRCHRLLSRLFALCIFISALAPLAVGGEISGLYQAEVPVTGQGEKERTEAIRSALSEVLVKVSGNRESPGLPLLEPVIASPVRLVQQYRYQELPEPEALPSVEDGGSQPAADGEKPYTQVLAVSFDVNAVNQALNAAGLPVWGRARPTTLVWLAIEDREGRQLVGADTEINKQKDLRVHARRRGLPLVLPLLDLEDQMSIRFTDVWGNFTDAILGASSRYQPQAVLVGRLYRDTSDVWQARWTLYLDGAAENWMASGQTPFEVLGQGIDGAADSLAQRFSRLFSESTDGVIPLVVTAVNSLDDYARVQKYLASLDSVTRLQVRQLSEDTVTFGVEVRGNRAGLVQNIAFGDMLAPIPSDTNVSGADSPDGLLAANQTTPAGLYYRLLK